MYRGFGIDGSTPVEAALETAMSVESAGYDSFWVSGSPHEQALEIVDGALARTGLDVGIGVFPLTRISADDLVAEVVGRELAQDRLWLGVGSARAPGALDEVRRAADTFRERLDVKVVTGAVGPKMMAVSGEVADAVILTWSFVDEVSQARAILERSAAGAGRETPALISFIRCALLPQAARALEERANRYDAIPTYRKVFEKHGLTAADTVITGSDREELLTGIEREESVLDMPVIRAIPAEETSDSLGELVTACRP